MGGARIVRPVRGRPPDPPKRNPALGGTGFRESDQACWPIDPENNPPASSTQSQFGEALTAWARKRGEHIADEFLKATEQGDATAWFEKAIASEKLLLRLRASAEAAFVARIAAAAGSRR